MGFRAHCRAAAWSIACVGWLVWLGGTVAQEPQPPVPPAPAAPVTVTQADLKQAVDGLAKQIEMLHGVVTGYNDRVGNLERDVNQLKIGPAAGSPSAPVAVPPTLAVVAPPVPGTQPPPAGPPPVVAPSFWTVQAAQELGLYRFEPRIVEATGIAADIFGLAANAASAAKSGEELQSVVNSFRDQFLKRLEASGRTELTVQTWGNAANAWLAQVVESLKTAKDFTEYQAILVAALRDGQKNAPLWGAAIDKAHDEARGGPLAGTAPGGGSAVNSGGYGGSGYLPPMAAFHNAWHVRRMNRVQARINLYSGR